MFLWYHENEKYKEQKLQTRDQSVQEYPQIITQLMLFLGTGMSVTSALEAVTAEYEKEQMRGNKGKIFVYEQMKKTCREISFGVSQTKAFADMGQKIGVPSYQKLSVLLVQSIKRKGEEASTKLLAPMMIMLVVILILLMFPALSQFS